MKTAKKEEGKKVVKSVKAAKKGKAIKATVPAKKKTVIVPKAVETKALIITPEIVKEAEIQDTRPIVTPEVIAPEVIAPVTEKVKTAKVPKRKVIRSMRQIITSSTHGKLQQRTIGTREVKNKWGHFEGTIAAKIDIMISHANFTKKQIVANAGTKMSRVNAHINHLRTTKGFIVKIDPKTKVVFFG